MVEKATTDSASSSNAQERCCNALGRDTAACTDEELAALAQAGDSRAFGELVHRHFATCMKRAFSMLHNRNDAEDEVQNAFSKAFESLRQFRFEGSFSAWLCRIVQNQCLMCMRARRQAGFISVDGMTDSRGRLELIDQMTSPEDELGTQEVDNLLRAQISRMPPLMRAVMMLRDIENLPIGEVADRLGLTVPAAKSRLMRARKEMRYRLIKHCGQRGQQTLTYKVNYSRAEYSFFG